MKSFASALTLFAAANAATLSQKDMPYALPQYEEAYAPMYDWYTPTYTPYSGYVEKPKAMYPSARDYPLLEDTMSAALAWANPYWPSQYTKKSASDDIKKGYDDAANIIKGAANALDYQEKKLAATLKKLPKDDYMPVYEAPKIVYSPHEIYSMPVHRIVTPYEWYQVSGQCQLTDEAYGQCVSWKQGGEYSGRKDIYRTEHEVPKSYAKKEPYRQKYQKTVAKVNSKTGMAYLDTEYGTYDQPYMTYQQPKYENLDLYRKTSVLPVEITDSYGQKRHGRVVEKDNKGDSKDVTIFDDATGQQNTLRIKDSQNIVHIQEVDDKQDLVRGPYGELTPVYAPDTQLVTVCDEETYTCEVIALDLDGADQIRRISLKCHLMLIIS